MKNLLFKIPLLLLLLSNCLLKAQGERLASFNAVRLDGRNVVEVKWVLKANVSCQSPQVQRSVDAVNFNTIYTYPGVCGGSANEENYSWIDSDALENYKLYYRLRIDDAEYSTIDSVEKQNPSNENGIYLYPNPSSADFFISYEPSFGKLEGITMFHANGNEIHIAKERIKVLNRGLLKISPAALAAGIYYIKCSFSEGYERQIKLIFGP